MTDRRRALSPDGTTGGLNAIGILPAGGVYFVHQTLSAFRQIVVRFGASLYQARRTRR